MKRKILARLSRFKIERFSVGADLRVCPGAADPRRPGQTRRSAPTIILGLLRLLLSILWLSAVSGILLCAPAQAPLFWEADVSRGTSVFGSLERAPGNISVTTDPLGLYGGVYRYDTWDDPSYAKERCESKGTRR